MSRQARLRSEGYCWFRGLLPPEEVERLAGVLGRAGEGRGGRRLGIREWGAARRILEHPLVAAFLRRVLGDAPRLVRAVLFDKGPSARWGVPWHRDTVVPVREHRPSRLFTGPSVKDGQPHMRAPVSVLRRMLTLGLHLDAADGGNGALQVIPGSHRPPFPEVDRSRAVLCEAEPGDLLVLRPLLLHASTKPETPRSRRVLHLETAGFDRLPDGLEWPDVERFVRPAEGAAEADSRVVAWHRGSIP